MTHHTPQKLRTVRCVASGKVTSQSSNKTKRLLKLGGYVEVTPGYAVHVVSPRAPSRLWRVAGMVTGSVLAVIAALVWLMSMI